MRSETFTLVIAMVMVPCTIWFNCLVPEEDSGEKCKFTNIVIILQPALYRFEKKEAQINKNYLFNRFVIHSLLIFEIKISKNYNN